MDAQTEDGYELIHLGGETAVIVPLHEYRVLKLLEERVKARAAGAAQAAAADGGEEPQG
jgi:hypothetical protein